MQKVLYALLLLVSVGLYLTLVPQKPNHEITNDGSVVSFDRGCWKLAPPGNGGSASVCGLGGNEKPEVIGRCMKVGGSTACGGASGKT